MCRPTEQIEMKGEWDNWVLAFAITRLYGRSEREKQSHWINFNTLIDCGWLPILNVGRVIEINWEKRWIGAKHMKKKCNHLINLNSFSLATCHFKWKCTEFIESAKKKYKMLWKNAIDIYIVFENCQFISWIWFISWPNENWLALIQTILNL